MDAPANQRWFLRKHEDGSVFGPMDFDQLQRWASNARIAPHDKISTDQQTWMKAPMVPQLGMDWLVEVTTERYYGPTTMGAIEEFVRLGEINDETFLLNSCDGSRYQIAEIPDMLERARMPSSETGAEFSDEPAATGMLIDMQERIRELEQSLDDERRALRDADERYRELEARYNELAANQAAREATL